MSCDTRNSIFSTPQWEIANARYEQDRSKPSFLIGTVSLRTLYEHFVSDKLFAEIGVELNISREMVRQYYDRYTKDLLQAETGVQRYERILRKRKLQQAALAYNAAEWCPLLQEAADVALKAGCTVSPVFLAGRISKRLIDVNGHRCFAQMVRREWKPRKGQASSFAPLNVVNYGDAGIHARLGLIRAGGRCDNYILPTAHLRTRFPDGSASVLYAPLNGARKDTRLFDIDRYREAWHLLEPRS